MKKTHHKVFPLVLLIVVLSSTAAAQRSRSRQPGIAPDVLLQIVRAEDERSLNDSLKRLLFHPDAVVRKRAVLAAGRIGSEGAVPVLAEILLGDRDTGVREEAAFALGEIELPGGASALVNVVSDENK